ncbi:MAG: hypothetical protein LBC96_06815 [Lachnospiraceae bacterium]|jgi:hypothetical protein|nr:hypothetical protein [Lachnospiraceae bacterium]
MENEKNLEHDETAAVKEEDAPVSEDNLVSKYLDVEKESNAGKDKSVKEENTANAEADAEKLKKEAEEAFNQTKETIKNIDVKEDAKRISGFISDMWNDPMGKIKDVVNNSDSYLTLAILVTALWVIAVLLRRVLSNTGVITNGWAYFIRNIFSTVFGGILMPAISPVLVIVVMATIIFLLNRKKLDKITLVIVVVAIANIPNAIGAVLSILTQLTWRAYTVISPINTFLSVVSVLLLYFGVKELLREEDNATFFKTFIVIQAVYHGSRFVLSFLNIYL